MTESGCTHVTPVNDGVLGSCGRLLSHASARIVSLETGEDLPPGEEGELLLKTPWVSFINFRFIFTIGFVKIIII